MLNAEQIHAQIREHLGKVHHLYPTLGPREAFMAMLSRDKTFRAMAMAYMQALRETPH